jgi:hypothetical protein
VSYGTVACDGCHRSDSGRINHELASFRDSSGYAARRCTEAVFAGGVATGSREARAFSSRSRTSNRPPRRNVNSRFALETAELVRAQKGDGEAGAFCHDLSRAFFTEHADISKREVIFPIAERFGISASDVETAWHERRFSPTVDAFMEDGHKLGVRGVPAMGWPNRRAIVGLMPPTELVLRLRNEAERLRE